MITNITQSALVSALQATVGQTNSQITTTVTGLLALNTTQTAVFSTYIASQTQTQWQDVINAISTLATSDYANFLPTIANNTPLDIQVLINAWTYLTNNMPTDLQTFMLAINPANILIQQGLIGTVPATDFVRRLIALFPNGWASDTALQSGGNLYALFMAAGIVLNIVSTLLLVTQESFYLTSADGTALDITVGDFLGTTLPRNLNETDASYRARAYKRIFQITDTRPGFYSYTNAIAPTRLIEPWAPADTGVYSNASMVNGPVTLLAPPGNSAWNSLVNDNITYTRPDSAKTYINSSKALSVAGANVWPDEYDPVTGAYKGKSVWQASTNKVLNSSAPATQTVTLAVGNYCIWCIGAGSIVSAAGTAVGSGFGTSTGSTFSQGTLPAGGENVITITTGGTVTLTVSGSLSYMQLEGGSIPTPYIPTTTTPVTRNADLPSILATALPGSTTTGSWVCAFNNFDGGASYNARLVGSDASGDSTILSTTNNYPGPYTLNMFNGTAAIITGNTTPGAASSIGGSSYSSAGRNLCLNGATVVSDAGIPFGSTPTTFYLGTDTASEALNGWISSLVYYPYAMTAAQLQAVTSTPQVWPTSPINTIPAAFYDYDTAAIPGRYTSADARYQGFADVNLANQASVPLAIYTLWPDGTSPLYSYVDAQTVNSIGEAHVPPVGYASYLYPVAPKVITANTVYSAILAGKALGTLVWVRLI